MSSTEPSTPEPPVKTPVLFVLSLAAPPNTPPNPQIPWLSHWWQGLEARAGEQPPEATCVHPVRSQGAPGPADRRQQWANKLGAELD